MRAALPELASAFSCDSLLCASFAAAQSAAAATSSMSSCSSSSSALRSSSLIRTIASILLRILSSSFFFFLSLRLHRSAARAMRTCSGLSPVAWSRSDWSCARRPSAFSL